MFIVYCWDNSCLHVHCVLLGQLLSSCSLCIAETTPIFMFIVYCWDNSYLHVHCVLLRQLLSSCSLCIAGTTLIFMFIVYCWMNSYLHVYCVSLGQIHVAGQQNHLLLHFIYRHLICSSHTLNKTLNCWHTIVICRLLHSKLFPV